MAVNTTSPITAPTTTYAAASTTSTKKPSFGLDADAFMNLFLVALKNQDPMNPMDESQMMSQMAQLTNLQQMTKLEEVVTGMQESLQGSRLEQGTSFIGKEIVSDATLGEDVTGVVKSVSIENGDIMLTLKDGTKVNLNQVKTVNGVEGSGV